MTKPFFSLFLILLSSFIYASDNQLTPREKADGWQLLFDGKDMSQWRNFKQADLNPLWVIEDGAMKLSGPNGGDIITKNSYKNFDFKIDWKIAKAGNSGILIMADEEGKYIFSHAPEIQILDNERHSDNKLEDHLSGSLYDMVAPHESSFKPAGEWNSVRIRLEDNLLQVWQNDVMTTNIVVGSLTWDKLVKASKFATWEGFGKNAQGHIGLQDHGDQVWFKNIKIKSLD
ncbi:3-keto-disaccharide hydrolase [Glaciecola sp. 1036]|uniref:3-keto-disaccharide hydrolase n=1 Tax=Alteromonadaceae TaxID=72275 RepID=UPI003CFC21DB